jgi:hypothetical protein
MAAIAEGLTVGDCWVLLKFNGPDQLKLAFA